MDNSPLLDALFYCLRKRVTIGEELARSLSEIGINIKALTDYYNALYRVVLIYVSDLQTKPLHQVSNFGVDFATVIETQLPEAWYLGMRENGATEMLEEWQLELDTIIASERARIPDFAEFIARQAYSYDKPGLAMQKIQPRLDLWANRYNDVYNIAISRSADEKTKEIWVFGDTDHCTSCEKLNGIVAYHREWVEYGLQPQNPPNDKLECGGWRCQCQLVPTDQRVTPKAKRLRILAEVSGD